MHKYELIGHQNIISYFKIILKKDYLSSGYLFIGKEGIGKRKTARFISMLLNCKEQTRPCFNCLSCTKIERRVHPDVLEIYPVNSIGIEKIRQIQQKTSLKSFSSVYKIVIIDEADTLTQDASNAFLKTLEEPPAGVIFFLITSKPQNLLATICSRTQKIWFSLKFKDLRDYLRTEGFDIHNINLFLKLSDGRLSIIDELKKINYSSKKEKLFKQFPLSIYESKRNSLKDTTYLLISFLRDCIFFKMNKVDNVINTDVQAEISQYQRRFNVTQLLDKIDGLFLINQALDNINVNLANNLIAGILN